MDYKWTMKMVTQALQEGGPRPRRPLRVQHLQARPEGDGCSSTWARRCSRRHPESKELLLRDVPNVVRFFRRRGIYEKGPRQMTGDGSSLSFEQTCLGTSGQGGGLIGKKGETKKRPRRVACHVSLEVDGQSGEVTVKSQLGRGGRPLQGCQRGRGGREGVLPAEGAEGSSTRIACSRSSTSGTSPGRATTAWRGSRAG